MGHASTNIRQCSVSEVIHGHAISQPFSLLFGGAELAVTSGSTPHSSCIQGCRYSAALLYACRGHTSRMPVVWIYT